MENKYFGVMLDCSRNAVMKPTEVINFAKILKTFGYNMLQLYTEDTYEVEGEPFFGYMRGRYTCEELTYIVAECEKIGVEVIPCIQTLAHLNQVIRWNGPYGEITDIGDILLAEEPRTYQLIENMFKSLRKSFKTEYVHIGMDEAEMIGRGKYFNKHGLKSHLAILKDHLAKVVEIAKNYGFKPIMWSDMFFKLATKNGEYYDINANVTEEVKNAASKDVGLVYWDYYHDDKAIYDGMMSAHRKFDNDVWFAGGAWTWVGFASGNDYTLKTMIPAMQSARENGIDKIFLTMWGDNGKECSYYSVLPSLFAVKKCYDGEMDMDKIKKEFKEITGEDFDTFLALDTPNYVGGNDSILGNVSKYALFSDPFNGFLDCTCNKEGVTSEYKILTQKLEELAKTSKYAYLFESASALCDVLSVKYNLGSRTRKAYQAGDKAELKTLVNDYNVVLEKLEIFYKKFRALWYKENKPTGFDVQDLRLGGLKQRLVSCRERLEDYLAGKEENILELEEKLLNFYGENTTPTNNFWDWMVTANKI